MSLGRKTSVVLSSLGVKNSRLYHSLGVKQSHSPNIDVDGLMRNQTSNGIINNTSNSNENNYQPIRGVNLPYHQVAHHQAAQNKNYLEKAHKMQSKKSGIHFG